MDVYSSVASICGLVLQKIPMSITDDSISMIAEPHAIPLAEVSNEICDSLSCNAGLFARFMREVADALISIHEAGLVHGNIRPQTIIIDGSSFSFAQPATSHKSVCYLVNFENSRWDLSERLKHNDAFDLGNTFVWFLTRIAFGRSFADQTTKAPFLTLLRDSIKQLGAKWSRQYCFAIGQVVSGLIETDVRNRVPVFAVPDLIRYCAQFNPFDREYFVRMGLMDDAANMFFMTELSRPLVRRMIEIRNHSSRDSRTPSRSSASIDFLESLEPKMKSTIQKLGHVLTDVTDKGFHRSLFDTYVLSMIFFVEWGGVELGTSGAFREEGPAPQEMELLKIVQMALLASLVDRIPLKKTEDLNTLKLVRDVMCKIVSVKPSDFVSSCLKTRHTIISELARQDMKLYGIYGKPHMASTYFLSVCVSV